MTQQTRISLQGLKILRAFMEDPRKPLSGAEIARATGLMSGSLYPILIRFEKAGLLSSEWETGDPVELGRPRRRFYSIRASGQMAFHNHVGPLTLGQLNWAR